MKHIWLTAILGLAALPAQAQTMLTIAATGQNVAVPDEATASLTVQANAADAAGAQAQVNAAMAKALASARTVPGVVATTSEYNAYSSQADASGPVKYSARQNLNLVIPSAGGVPPDAFSSLLAKLQQDGLLMSSLGGDLSDAGQTKAGQAAILDALSQIKAQAAAIAANLHEHVGGMKALDVSASPQPGPRPLMMMAKSMDAGAAPPQSAPENVTVQANVTAQVELLPE